MDVEAVPAGLSRNPLIFYSSPGTLVSLACSKVALICWSYEIRGLYPDESYLVKHWFIKHKFSCVNVFETSIPSSLVIKIDNYIKIVGAELKKWMDDLYEIFGYDVHDPILRCIDHIIFESNGVISYDKTARNLIDRDGLSSYEKYKIACKYCFESEVERIWHAIPNDPKLHNGYGSADPVQCYWGFCMENEPLEEDPENDSICYSYCAYTAYGAWTMLEYFWNRFNHQQQSSVILSIMKTSDTIKYLLPVLSSDQLTFVLNHIPHKILRNLTDNENSCHYAFQVWDYMLNGEITNDTIFLDILVDLCKIIKDADEHRCINFTDDIAYSTHATRRKLLNHVWITAPDDLKIFILNQHVLTLFNELFDLNSSIFFKAYGFNMDFFLDLLANSKFQLRNELWLKFWRKFVVFAAPSDLKIIMELCLPKNNEHDVVEFKKRMVDYDTLKMEFDLFVINGRCVELGNYLKLFCSSGFEEKRVRRQIVDSNVNRIFQFDFETLKNFRDFIDGAFSSASFANKRKEEYFRNNLSKIYTFLDNGLLNNVMNITNLLLFHNQKYLTEMKQFLFVRFRSNLIYGSVCFIMNFNFRNWQEFIKWCTRTDDDFFKFKNNLPVDHIFEAWLITLIEWTESPSYVEGSIFLTPLNNFLRWYLDDEAAVKKFLLEKITYHEQWNSIRNILEKKESKIVYEMLRWVFNKDKKQIREFCKRSELKIVDISRYLK